MKDAIKAIFTQLGADLCGIAHIDRFEGVPNGFHPRDIYPECKSVITFAKRLPKGLTQVSPRIIYNRALEINVLEIDRIGLLASLEIEDAGYGFAVPVPSDGPYEYWDAEAKHGKGILSMRHAAMLSGIGSMGKNTLITNRRFGNLINIGAVLTNKDLESDALAENLCIDGCKICIENCPTKALDGNQVNQKLCREFTYTNNSRGFSVVNCNRCRISCPRVFGIIE